MVFLGFLRCLVRIPSPQHWYYQVRHSLSSDTLSSAEKNWPGTTEYDLGDLGFYLDSGYCYGGYNVAIIYRQIIYQLFMNWISYHYILSKWYNPIVDTMIFTWINGHVRILNWRYLPYIFGVFSGLNFREYSPKYGLKNGTVPPF